jgi:tetratricopeptide (TPR) repeat protein
MNKKLFLPVFLTSMLLLTSCAGKFIPTSDYFTVTPQVLVSEGGKVNATVDGNFPAKTFPTTAIVTITPVLKYEGGETSGTAITLQGEKVKGNNKVINKTGGTFSVSSVFNYIPAMSKSELYLRFTTTIGKKVIAIPEIKVADGVINTETLANAKSTTPSMATDKFQRNLKEAQDANILFLIEQAKIRESELKGTSVAAFDSKISATAKDSTRKITGIEVSSYASPDGSLELNEKLAGEREKATVTFLENTLKKAKANSAINAKFTAEDWDGFKDLVSKSDIQDKDLILRVLSMYNDPEQREEQIKNMSSIFQVLAEEILPQLRRSKMTLSIDVIGKSDATLKNLALNDPSKLDLEELLYASSLVKGSDKTKIYANAANLFPNDYRAFNNLGAIALKSGDLTAAKTNLEKAYSLSKTPDVNNNLAIYSLATGAAASTIDSYLGAAGGAEGSNETLGLQYLKKGQYAKAVQSFGNTKSNNAALAQILTKDYSKAKSTLDAVAEPTAETSYLKAVVGARTNNKDLVVSGLTASIKADKSYAKKALTDLEFSKFVTDPSIAALLQ